jgi:hypothetical protein
MARTVNQINSQIQTALVSNFAAIGITVDPTQWSKRNIMMLFCFAFAVCAAYIEQLMDFLKTSLETTAAQSAAASPLWIQNQMFLFQYSDNNPQVILLSNGAWAYPVVDPTLRIITACSVNSTSPNQVSIKIATGNPFVALLSNQIAAAQGFINLIGTAGIIYAIQSLNSDKLYINANIYFQGQYASVIQTNVINALNSFLQNLSITNFNGSIKMTDLESTIRGVAGIDDVVLLNVRGRKDTDSYSAGINLVLNSTVIQRLWNPISGYVSEETTTRNTFADTLNFIAE